MGYGVLARRDKISVEREVCDLSIETLITTELRLLNQVLYYWETYIYRWNWNAAMEKEPNDIPHKGGGAIKIVSSS
jgi:hypothetical protein